MGKELILCWRRRVGLKKAGGLRRRKGVSVGVDEGKVWRCGGSCDFLSIFRYPGQITTRMTHGTFSTQLLIPEEGGEEAESMTVAMWR